MKLFSKKEAKKTEAEKIEARREEVLAAGRKFKYPLQWTRHRVVINTVLIALVVFTMVILGVWLALYRIGMTDDLLFNVTKVVPLSVASVDGEDVRFSDYLMFYRSSMISIERQSGSQFDEESFDELKAEYKRIALTEAEKYTYAIKLAKELNVELCIELNDESKGTLISESGCQGFCHRSRWPKALKPRRFTQLQANSGAMPR